MSNSATQQLATRGVGSAASTPRRSANLTQSSEFNPAPKGFSPLNQGSEPIRALWIAPSFFPRVGGLEVYLESVASSLSSFCQVGLVTKAGQWFPGDEPISHFTVSEMQPRRLKQCWQTVAELAEILSRFAPDLVHLGGAEVAVHRWAIPDSIPVVATIHGNDLTLARSTTTDPGHLTRLVEGLNGCENIFAVSQHTAGLCREWGITTPITVVAAGVDTEYFCPWPAIGEQARRDFQMPEDVPILLTVSRLVPRKGHLCVLDAIRRLPFPVNWVVAGDGPCRDQLLKVSAEYGLEGRVSFWGALADDDLPGLYNACDMFVFTPEERRLTDGRVDSEGFGLVYLEASACGKPVIGSRVSGCKDAIIDGATGILVQPGNPDQLAKAVEFLVRNPAIARDLGAGGLTFARASGGWPRLARQMIEKYHEILHPTDEMIELPPLRIPI